MGSAPGLLYQLLHRSEGRGGPSPRDGQLAKAATGVTSLELIIEKLLQERVRAKLARAIVTLQEAGGLSH